MDPRAAPVGHDTNNGAGHELTHFRTGKGDCERIQTGINTWLRGDDPGLRGSNYCCVARLLHDPHRRYSCFLTGNPRRGHEKKGKPREKVGHTGQRPTKTRPRNRRAPPVTPENPVYETSSQPVCRTRTYRHPSRKVPRETQAGFVGNHGPDLTGDRIDSKRRLPFVGDADRNEHFQLKGAHGLHLNFSDHHFNHPFRRREPRKGNKKEKERIPRPSNTTGLTVPIGGADR